MGKRKKSSRAPQGPKKREPLATTFDCLFCNHEKAIQVKLDKKAGVGNLYCKVCGQKFQTGINYLSAAVDVYSDWVDACENVAQEAAAVQEQDDGGHGAVTMTTEHRRLQMQMEEEEEREKDRKFSGYARGEMGPGGGSGKGEQQRRGRVEIDDEDDEDDDY